MMSGNISFHARKRRAEGQAVKPPSDRIARKKVLAASEVKTRVAANSLQLAAPGSFTLANAPGTGGQRKSSGNDVARAHDSEHSTKVQSQKDNGSDAAVLLDLRAIVLDGPHGGRRPKAYGHVTEGAGNSLLVLGQSGAQRDTWRVESTMYELHTPKLERREVSASHCSPSAVKHPRTNTACSFWHVRMDIQPIVCTEDYMHSMYTDANVRAAYILAHDTHASQHAHKFQHTKILTGI